MIDGNFFTIPERPSDVDQLRRMSAPLQQLTIPSWLDEADSNYYRYLGNRTAAGLTAKELPIFKEEIHRLELAGLVVERDDVDPKLHHLYIRSSADYDNWAIGIYRGTSLRDLQPAPDVTNPVLTRDDVTDVPAVLVADPFMIRRDDEWFMFFELLNWYENKGEIGLATSCDGLEWQYRRRVLVEAFHLSYPYVFEHDGHYYMVPESRQNKSVRLYIASDFPTNWRFKCELLNGVELVDASLFLCNEKWWMFAGDGDSDVLRLFCSDQLMGPWKEHPASPIVEGNAHIARPAGRVVKTKSNLYRLAQNCKPEYGREVRAFEVLELDHKTYREQELDVSPLLAGTGNGWNSTGMHHLDLQQLEDGTCLACVDGWKRADRLPNCAK